MSKTSFPPPNGAASLEFTASTLVVAEQHLRHHLRNVWFIVDDQDGEFVGYFLGAVVVLRLIVFFLACG